MEIAGKNIVVTGGGNGIGKALCERFAVEGAAAITVVDLDLENAEKVASTVNGTARRIDVGDRDAVIGLVKDVEEGGTQLTQADMIAAMTIEGLLATDTPFAAELQALRPQPGQAVSAANLRAMLADSPIVGPERGFVGDEVAFVVPDVDVTSWEAAGQATDEEVLRFRPATAGESSLRRRAR